MSQDTPTIYDLPPASDGLGGPHPLAGVPQSALDAAVRALVEGGRLTRGGTLLVEEEDIEPVAHAVLLAALQVSNGPEE